MMMAVKLESLEIEISSLVRTTDKSLRSKLFILLKVAGENGKVAMILMVRVSSLFPVPRQPYCHNPGILIACLD